VTLNIKMRALFEATNKNNTYPLLLLTLGACIISFSSILVKTSHVAPLVSAFYRVFFGSIFLIFACFVKKEFKKRSLKKNLLAVLCGFIFSLDLGTWHFSIQFVGPGLATLLANLQVFILSGIGFFLFREKLGLKFVLSLLLAFFGLFLMIGVDIDHVTWNYMLGIGLGLSTAISYSIFLLLLRYIQSDQKELSFFYYLMIVSISSSFFLGAKIFIAKESFAIPDISSILSLLCLGLFCQTIAWVAISNALPKVKASLAGLILLLQPTLSFLLDVILFNRQTGPAGWIGVTIAIIAIYFAMQDSTKT